MALVCSVETELQKDETGWEESNVWNKKKKQVPFEYKIIFFFDFIYIYIYTDRQTDRHIHTQKSFI